MNNTIETDPVRAGETVLATDPGDKESEKAPARLAWALPPFVFSPIRPEVQEAKPDGAQDDQAPTEETDEKETEEVPGPLTAIPPVEMENGKWKMENGIRSPESGPISNLQSPISNLQSPILSEEPLDRPAPETAPPSTADTAAVMSSLQETVGQLAASLATLEERLAALPAEPPKSQAATVDILVPPGGEAVEIPLKLRVETEDSRQLALLRELHDQREQLHTELAGAHRQIERLGKTQFKSSNAMESLRKSADETVAELRSALAARDQELAELRNLAEEVRKEYRAHLAQELLRIADGLERSQQEADRLRASFNVSVKDLRPEGFWGRWRSGSAHRAQEFLRERQAALASWQEGMGFVQQRLLALLADAGVEPMEALGQPFDPHRHVAVGKVNDPAQPDNVVVEEQLKGYVMGDRMLRFAEVVVNKVESGEDPGI